MESPALVSSDELVDRCFSRPLARGIVAVVSPTPVTPNMLTFVAMCFGIATGVALGLQQGVWAAVAIAGYLTFDCSDGQLARKRGGGGLVGRIVDGFGDYVAAISIHLGLMAWMIDSWGFLIAVPCVVGASWSIGWNSFLLDRYKQRYKGATDDFEAIDEVYRESNWFQRLIVKTFRRYARRVDGGVVIPDLAAYQQRMRFPMRLWVWIGPTTHFTVMAICAVFESPLTYLFVACLPFNVLAGIALGVQTRLERGPPPVVVRAS